MASRLRSLSQCKAKKTNLVRVRQVARTKSRGKDKPKCIATATHRDQTGSWTCLCNKSRPLFLLRSKRNLLTKMRLVMFHPAILSNRCRKQAMLALQHSNRLRSSLYKHTKFNSLPKCRHCSHRQCQREDCL